MKIPRREPFSVGWQHWVSLAGAPFFRRVFGRQGLVTFLLAWALNGLVQSAFAAAVAGTEGPVAVPVDKVFTNATTPLTIEGYRVKGDPLLTNASFALVLARTTGTNMSLVEVVRAASELQGRYRASGFTNVTISIGREQIRGGTVTMNVFRGLVPQIVVDGWRCAPVEAAASTTSTRTNGPASGGTPRASTNAAPGFLVRAYEIRGDTLLSDETLTGILQKYTGTNITVADIMKAGSEMQMEYRTRGYPTVNVTIPPQKIDSNAIVKIRVFQGRLAEINVVGNRYFSSNNVMRTLPSLRTNMILLEPVFQAELDRANANQDRQIYPEIAPGQTQGTTILDLKVKDRLPLHAKVDFNNQNSPGTPELRLNASAVYNNLWQLEHSMGLQYGFSPTEYKSGDDWNFYDLPLVANYGGFYRLPLGSPSSVAGSMTQRPGTFGYDEATRRFRLPPPSGQAEFNLFASRSTIDTGVMTLFDSLLYNTNGNTLQRRDVQQDLTVNEDVGARLTIPFRNTAKFQSGISAGVDYKAYELTSAKTNIFTLTSEILDNISNPGHIITNINVSTVVSPVPTTIRNLDYLPLSLRYSASLRDPVGVTSFGLGMSVNGWYSGSIEGLRDITGSTDSSGHWLTLNPSLMRDFIIHTNWMLSLAASGQWADEPLPSNEQFGVGGVGSVRGYHEGEVFGNSGWWLTAEQKTPPQVIGRVYGRSALSVRGSVYMGYGQAFSLSSRQNLWGVGFGSAASIGANWEARFLFSWPLLSTAFTQAGQPRFDFGLSAQF